MDHDTYVLELLDTDEHMFRTCPAFLCKADGFLCVYSVTSRSSFDEVASYREHLVHLKHQCDLPVVLVGNKRDLEEERQVTSGEGEAMAKSFGCPFVETSAMSRTEVEAAFHELMHEVCKKKDSEHHAMEQGKKQARTCVVT
eukprot:TRINITY_DN3567_c0_g1_i1.p2 TRINITY_DN3567_c0_g1~~TRINITY_DN3567_c0_g1_i1.p2  ORF type:complete len:142 (-),score=45.67 TRINITY_DN3567_c0_g1_i1:466-891(-)